MNEVVYYAARTLLVVAWLVVAVAAWRLRARAMRPWTGIALAAAVFASMRAWPWNYLLLDGARAVLRAFGVYDDRLGAKVVVGALLAVAIVLAVRSLRRTRWAANALGCAVAIAAQACLLAIETMSLDDLLPRLVLAQPGRYLFEGGCALAALVTALRARRGGMDLVMQVAWTIAAIGAVLVVRRRAGTPRGMWWLIAGCVGFIALDKALDLQVLLLALAKWVVRTSAGGGLGDERRLVRDVLLVVATLLGLAGLVWLHRSQAARERGTRLALAGIAMVVVLVGLRLVPAFAWLHDERVGWAFEAVALGLVGTGLRLGWRSRPGRST